MHCGKREYISSKGLRDDGHLGSTGTPTHQPLMPAVSFLAVHDIQENWELFLA